MCGCCLWNRPSSALDPRARGAPSGRPSSKPLVCSAGRAHSLIVIVRSAPNWPSFLWHHRVHTEKRGERLSYWRIAFGTGYERDRVAAGIEAACAECHLKGVIVYELFGADDLLIRAWLPHGRKFEEFEAALTDELASTGLNSCYPFAVDCMVRHWPFTGVGGRPEAPEESAISHLQDAEILEVETKWPDIDPALYERLLDERLLDD
jgi:hypothetical protein